MIERIPALVNDDPAITRWGRHLNDSFMVEVGTQQYLLTVRAGQVESVVKGPLVQRAWRFAIRAKAESWEKFWHKVPAPGWNDLFALLRRGDVAFEGDQRMLMAHLLYLKLLLAAPRKLAT